MSDFKIFKSGSNSNSTCLNKVRVLNSEMSISEVKVPFKLDVFTVRTENSKILLLCSVYHYAVG